MPAPSQAGDAATTPASAEPGRGTIEQLAGAVHHLLVTQRGWSPERYRDWLADTLARALLPDTQTGPTRGGAPEHLTSPRLVGCADSPLAAS